MFLSSLHRMPPTKRQSEAFCSVYQLTLFCWSPKTRSYALLVCLSPEHRLLAGRPKGFDEFSQFRTGLGAFFVRRWWLLRLGLNSFLLRRRRLNRLYLRVSNRLATLPKKPLATFWFASSLKTW
jgi:hypothetical protein